MSEPKFIIPPENVTPGNMQPPISPQLPPTPTAGIALQDPQVRKSKLIWIIIGVIAGIVLIVMVLSYIIILRGKTSWGQAMQDNAWEQFILGTVSEPIEQSITVTYTDTGSYEFTPSSISSAELDAEAAKQLDEQYGFTMRDLKVMYDLSSYSASLDTEAPQFDGVGTLRVSNDSKVLQGEVGLKLSPTESFMSYDYNSDMGEFLQSKLQVPTNSPAKGVWVRLNEQEMQTVRNVFTQTLRNTQHTERLSKNRLFTISAFRGFEFRQDTIVIHYELALDKNKLRNVLLWDIEEALGENYTGPVKQFSEQLTDALLAKLTVQEYDIWVGITNKKVYKLSATINTISVTKIVKTTVDKIQAQELENVDFSGLAVDSDAQRVADMRMITSALELYYNDTGTYPANKDGLPVGLTPTYVGAIPTAPTPPSGTCDTYKNTYWYTRTSPTTYTYEFCLGKPVGGFREGPNTLTEAGMTTPPTEAVPEDGALSESMSPNEDTTISKLILDIINNLAFDATLTINYEMLNHGTEKVITAPADYKNSDFFQ